MPSFWKSGTAGAIDKKRTWDLVQPIGTIKSNKMGVFPTKRNNQTPNMDI